MATIIYSMCGEGRGHATRVQTMVEMMVPKHRFVLLAARDAYHQLYLQYQDHPLVSVRRLPGLFFAYRGQKVDYFKSIVGSIPYLWRLSAMVRYVSKMVERDRPSLAITDFEPVLPRVARKHGIPLISLDHQHFLSVSDFRYMPWRFRWRGLFLRSSIPLFYRGQSGEAVSSFHHLPPRPGTESVPRIGVLLRDSILTADRSVDCSNGPVLVYVRKAAPDSFWRALENSSLDVIVYGIGQRTAMGRVQFKPISDSTFVDDLVKCRCLVTTAGNQLVGEAFYLRKPVLAIPEPGNFEQQLNGWLVADSKGGWTTSFEQITPHLIQQFLVALPTLRKQLESLNVSGNREAFDFIESFLPASDILVETPFENRNTWEPETAFPSLDTIESN